MTTARNILDEMIETGCSADGPSVQVGVDARKEPGPDAHREACPSVLLHVNEDVYEDEEETTGLDDYCECGRLAIGDHCQQCGLPLCPMCSETGAGFCKDHPDEHYEDSWQEDAYEDLRQATPEELLEAAAWFLRQDVDISLVKVVEDAIKFLRAGFALAQPGGWQHVAPHWLRESKKAVDVVEKP